MIQFAIIMPVYQRKDGKSFNLVKRAINSVLEQTYKNFKIYLIGDKYDDDYEFKQIASLVSYEKIYFENLEFAAERSKYRGHELWNVGGTNATNTALDRIFNDNIDWVCYLDYDDFYLSNHLEVINDAIQKTKANFISTIALHEKDSIQQRFLPCHISENQNYFNNYFPTACFLTKTSICVNHKHFNYIKFRNMIEECNQVYAGDADLFNRIKDILIAKNEFGILVNVHTCCTSPSGYIIEV